MNCLMLCALLYTAKEENGRALIIIESLIK
jgi:hypothetical protein